MLRNKTNTVQRVLVTYLCFSLCLSFVPRQANAQIGSKVQIRIGKPSVWSMGQAHYLLAQMRQKNRTLQTKMPDEATLDPNSINATSISILKTLLDVRGEYNQKLAVENSQARREESINLQRRDEARLKLAGKLNERDDLIFRIEDMERKLARLSKEKELRDKEREDEPLTAEDRARELRIADLESTLTSSNAAKTRLDSEITKLETTATANVGATSLTAASVPTDAGGSLPTLDNLKDYITHSIGQVKQPSLSASIALDNYIGMQYEIIAKQLTLLRDELGPDERIVFLELPSTIYTVPDKADDYLVQLRWKVKHYYKSDPDPDAHKDSRTEWEKIETGLYDVGISELSGQCAEDVQPLQGNEQPEKPTPTPTPTHALLNWLWRFLNLQDSQLNKNEGWRCVNPSPGDQDKSIKSVRDGMQTREPNLRRSAVRALDVIPRQSALNVNETYATANKKNFLGVFKLLTGLGLQVNYQRERQLYEQFLQQEIFASGFGKGREEFGWTFGPQPGTKRVSPGLRTTYAVLAVPRFASALDIEVEGVAYLRKTTPNFDHQTDNARNQLVTRESFVVRIPNEITEKFEVDEVEYTPVKKGESVTVKLKGRNFSPQIGVLVNAIPLTRALSLANNESANAASLAANGSGVQGAFELMSSGDIMVTFNMGNAAFIGTPTITLVAPERTESINEQKMDKINNFSPSGGYIPTLKSITWVEPMFNESLSLKEFVKDKPLGEVTVSDGEKKYTYVKGRLFGTGMLPWAEIEIDGREIPVVDQKTFEQYVAETKEHGDQTLAKEGVYQNSTGEYRIFARVENKNKFEVRYKHLTTHGFDVATLKYTSGDQPQVRRYIAEAEKGHSLVDLRIRTTIPEGRLKLSLGPDEQKTEPKVKFEGDNYVRAVFIVPDEQLHTNEGKPVMAKRDMVTLTVADTQDSQDKSKLSFDVPLPVEPTITGIVNPKTQTAEGEADDEPVVRISGRNLHQVKDILFGEQRAIIIGNPTFDSIEVKVPKRSDVPDNGKITVGVRVITSANNKTSPGSYYTFLGKKKETPAAQQTPTPARTGQGGGTSTPP